MYKTMISVECDQCHSVLPEVITTINQPDICFFSLLDLAIEAENAGWQCSNDAARHTCLRCNTQDRSRLWVWRRVAQENRVC